MGRARTGLLLAAAAAVLAAASCVLLPPRTVEFRVRVQPAPGDPVRHEQALLVDGREVGVASGDALPAGYETVPRIVPLFDYVPLEADGTGGWRVAPCLRHRHDGPGFWDETIGLDAPLDGQTPWILRRDRIPARGALLLRRDGERAWRLWEIPPGADRTLSPPPIGTLPEADLTRIR